MIAKSQRINGVKPGQPASSRAFSPRKQRDKCGPDQKEVERVDLGGDRLRPERVGKGEKEARRQARQHRVRQPGREGRRHAHRRRPVNRRSQVHRARLFARVEPDEQVSESVVQRVCLPRSSRQRTGYRLKRGAIAEVEARKEGGVVAGERDRRGSGGS